MVCQAPASLPNPTGFDGCTIASVTTSGVLLGSGTDFKVTFFVGDASAEVAIAAPATAILQAEPSGIVGNTTGTIITLTYINGNGQPVADVQLVGSCAVDAGDGLISIPVGGSPGVTDVNGQTTARIVAQNMNDIFCPPAEPGTPTTGTCTFTTATGEPTAVVTLTGVSQRWELRSVRAHVHDAARLTLRKAARLAAFLLS